MIPSAVTIPIDIGPPGLRVSDEDRIWGFLKHLFEKLESQILGVVLKVQQNRHFEFSRHGFDTFGFLAAASFDPQPACQQIPALC